MSLLDKVKKLVGGNAEKAQDAIDKAADVIDDKTGGKHTEKIESGAEKAKEFVGKLDDDADAPAAEPSTTASEDAPAEEPPSSPSPDG